MTPHSAIKTVALGDLVNEYGGLIQTGPFGSQLHQRDYTEQGVPVVMPKDIRDGRIDERTVARVSEEKARELSRHYLKPRSIVFPRRGDIGKCAYIDGYKENFLCGTGCLKIELPTKILEPHFVYYYLSLPRVVKWLERNAVGTTMLNLSTRIMGRIHLPLLSLNHQRRVASILSAYDDLIENNRRRMRLLERAARLLYQEWFMRFRFPGHERECVTNGVPNGWERRRLGEVAPFRYGRSLKNEHRIPGDYPVYGSSGVIGRHREPLIAGPAIVVGRKGNVGSVFWSQRHFYPIDTVYYIESDDSSLFLYHALRHTTFINSDAAVPGLNRNFAHSRMILFPTKALFELFEQYATKKYEQINLLTRSNDVLAQARDMLLPRLMSGRIPV